MVPVQVGEVQLRQVDGLGLSKGVFARIQHVQETVVVLVFLVHGADQRRGGRQYVVDKNKDGLFAGQLDSLSYDVHKLAHRQVHGNQVFPLVDLGNVRVLHLFTDDGNPVLESLGDSLGLGLSLI